MFSSKTFADKEDLDCLLSLAAEGAYSGPQLSELFGCNVKTIRNALNSQGVHLPPNTRFKKTRICDESFFEVLTPISAYWAGFIAADGCLSARDNSLHIGLAEYDNSHLQKFRNAIHSDSAISLVESNKSARMGIYSQRIFHALVRMGITPNKSLTINAVSVPYALVSHFVRGVYDGDGSLSGKDVGHIQLNIAGNKPFLEWLQSVLIQECSLNKVKIYPLPSKAYKLQYTGSQIFRILDFMYAYSTPETRLDRKYHKYLSFKQKFGKTC